MEMKVIGIDLGKSVFHLVGMDQHGKVVARKRFSRSQMMVFTAKIPHCLIGMEACCGSHFVGAALTAQGHEVRLIPAQFVKPFLKSNKNDYLDAEAIAEAVQRPNMRFVPIKTDDQLDLQALHRVRDRLVSRRTSVINQMRAFLLERGITFRQGRAYLRKQIPELLEDAEQKLSPRLRQLVDRLWQEWKALEEQIEALSRDIDGIAGQDAACQRLLDVPGVGPLVATALVAAIGNGAAFTKGRDFAAWLGLVPRQHSTGGKAWLLGISKRGNAYLRRLFIHGARSIVMSLNRDNHAMGKWMSQLEARTHRNVLVVAVANKLARIAWAVLARGEVYRSTPAFVAS
ncbi:MAG TPA: IS110 family transposase [Terracidiphilus sp.]|jgi:transposase